MKRKSEVTLTRQEKPKKQKIDKNELKVLSWNIEDLGGGLSGRPRKRSNTIIDNIATILHQQLADIILIQEVLNKPKHGKSDPTDSLFKTMHIPSRSQHVRLSSDTISAFNESHESTLCEILDMEDSSKLGTNLSTLLSNVNSTASDCFMQGSELTSFNENLTNTFTNFISRINATEEPEIADTSESSNLGREELGRIYDQLLTKVQAADQKNYQLIPINGYTKNEAYGIIYNSRLLNVIEHDYIDIFSPADSGSSSARKPIKIRFQLPGSADLPYFDVITWHAPSTDGGLRNRAIGKLELYCDRLKHANPTVPIIIAGDFNTESNELTSLYAMRDTSHRSSPPANVRQHSTGSVVENAGSNSNRKENFDHIFLANNAGGKLLGKTGHKSKVIDTAARHINIHRRDSNSLSNHYPIYSIFLY